MIGLVSRALNRKLAVSVDDVCSAQHGAPPPTWSSASNMVFNTTHLVNVNHVFMSLQFNSATADSDFSIKATSS